MELLFSSLYFQNFTWLDILLHITYVFVALGNLGALYDGWRPAFFVEFLRSLVVFVLSFFYPLTISNVVNMILLAFSGISVVFWMFKLSRLSVTKNCFKKASNIAQKNYPAAFSEKPPLEVKNISKV